MSNTSILTLCGGQSNMSVSLQTELCRLLSRFGPVHASYAGGQLMNTWVAGSSAPFTRGANYNLMVANAIGLTPDRVVLQWFQGESDTTDNAATAIYFEKLEALEAFLKEDFATDDVRIAAAKIYPQSDLLPLAGNYITMRNGFDTWAAASPATRRAIETSGLYRPTANVHLSEWSTSGTPGSSLLYAARAARASIDFYDGAAAAVQDDLGLPELSDYLEGLVENEATARAAADALLVPKTTTVNGQALSGNVTITTITGNSGTATTLATGRTISATGDATWTSGSFNGSANVTALLTLATVNSNVGRFGSATQVPVFTVNAKGLVTAVANVTITNVTGNAATATALATGRTLAITGDLVWTSPSFTGAGNVTAAGTLATVNSNVGTFGSATQAVSVTVNAKGLVTAISNVTATTFDSLSNIVNTEVSVTGAVTLTASAFGKWHVCSGTSANYTVGLPAVSGNAGKFIGVRMAPGLTKLVTLDGNLSEAIDGALTRVMWANETAVLYCDGAAWTKVAGKSIPMQAVVALPSNQTISTTTITLVNTTTIVSDNTGLMADSTNKRINILRAGSYSLNALVTYTSFPANKLFQTRIHKNGAGYFDCPNALGVSSYVGLPLAKNDSFVAGDYLDLRAYHEAVAANDIFGSGQYCSLSASEIIAW